MKKRYAFLFDLKPTDYKGWAKGLKKAGYATNPKYPKLLIGIIEKNNLDQYDRVKKGKRKNRKDKGGKKQWRDKEDKQLAKQKRLRKGAHRVMKHENNIKYIEVKPEDSFEKIADEFEMGPWQLYKYNDWDKGEPLFNSGILYLQPKRNRAQDDYHIVGSGESMWDISQQHGIKLKKLYRKNRMDRREKPEVGEKLYLRKRKPRS
jgi:LysM repeat protein